MGEFVDGEIQVFVHGFQELFFTEHFAFGVFCLDQSVGKNEEYVIDGERAGVGGVEGIFDESECGLVSNGLDQEVCFTRASVGMDGRRVPGGSRRDHGQR